MKKKVLEFHDIVKEFPGVSALKGISFDLYEGEVLALMGENGAGKSTLVKCLTGAYIPTSGYMLLDGKRYDSISPTQSRQLGISAVYQEFTLVPELPVVENVFMGNLPGNGVIVDYKKMLRDAKKIFDNFQVDIDPTAMTSSLTPAMMQIVEIAKAVSLDTRILILDEPTAPLTIKEVDILFRIINDLKRKGVAIIYISHRLEEIFEITDRAVVLRDGEFICEVQTEMTSRPELIKAMVGREINDTVYPHEDISTDGVVLAVNNLTGNGVTDISFELHKSEILGFAGLVGAGRTELMSVIFGDVKKESGTIILNGEEVSYREPYQAIAKGIGLLPEDRKGRGLLLDKSVLNNITLSNLKAYCKYGVINKKEEKAVVQSYIDKLLIKTPNMEQKAQFLSGGNQQKLIVAKWLDVNSDILIFDEPTRGIDVAAKYEIYQLMHNLVEQGKSIIMVSSDIEELVGMSDRIVVIAEGHKAGEMKKDEFDREMLLNLASGNR